MPPTRPESSSPSRTLVFDLETTGLSVYTTDIISLAVNVLETGQQFDKLVRPPTLPIPRHITQLTGLTNDALRKSSSWSTVGTLLCEWLRDEVLCHRSDGTLTFVGHNCRKFDVPILIRHLSKLRGTHPVIVKRCAVVDTLRLLRSALPGLRDHKQVTVYKHLFGTTPANAHSALADVVALTRIVKDKRSKFYSEEGKRTKYDIRDFHDLKSCKNILTVTSRPVDIGSYMRAPARQAHQRHIKCPDCSTIASPYFTHRCR
eukprot:gene5175-6295_t